MGGFGTANVVSKLGNLLTGAGVGNGVAPADYMVYSDCVAEDPSPLKCPDNGTTRVIENLAATEVFAHKDRTKKTEEKGVHSSFKKDHEKSVDPAPNDKYGANGLAVGKLVCRTVENVGTDPFEGKDATTPESDLKNTGEKSLLEKSLLSSLAHKVKDREDGTKTAVVSSDH